jgi:hypothetical protein
MPIVQSIVFKKDNIKLDDAIKWVKNNGYKIYKIDTTPTQYRFRQFSPELLKKRKIKPRYFTKVLSKTISFVMVN